MRQAIPCHASRVAEVSWRNARWSTPCVWLGWAVSRGGLPLSRAGAHPHPPVSMHRLERHTAPLAHRFAIEYSRKRVRLCTARPGQPPGSLFMRLDCVENKACEAGGVEPITSSPGTHHRNKVAEPLHGPVSSPVFHTTRAAHSATVATDAIRHVFTITCVYPGRSVMNGPRIAFEQRDIEVSKSAPPRNTHR